MGSRWVAPCDQPHTGEVFATYDSAPGTYPGQRQLQDEAERRCPDLIDGYAPGAGDGFSLFTLVPTDGGWRAGDRSTQWVATTETPATGSIRTRRRCDTGHIPMIGGRGCRSAAPLLRRSGWEGITLSRDEGDTR